MNGRRETRESNGEPRRGVLVVGHGTRSAAGIAEFHSVVEQLAKRLAPMPVVPCFLELAEPTIAGGLERLHACGTEHVIVAPLLLFAAGHAKTDIPKAVAAAPAVAQQGLTWTQSAPLGLHARVLDLSMLRGEEAIASLPEPNGCPITRGETLLLMVGRGAVDPEAITEMETFTELRRLAGQIGGVELAYTALAEPLVEQALPRVAASRYRRIIVQPHLLFTGQLLDRLQQQVQTAAAADRTKQWSVTAHLGPHPWVVDALAERIAAAERLT